MPLETCGTVLCLTLERAHTAVAGRTQGVDVRDSRVFVFGDGDTGLVREVTISSDGSLAAVRGTLALTEGGVDRIPHPTGLTSREPFGTFMGNTMGGRGEIFQLDWERFLENGTLDGAVLARFADGPAANGSRPEFVRLDGRWLLASADYGSSENEVRLYDPEAVARPDSKGAVAARFPCGPFVQSLHYWEERDLLILVQNVRHGLGWRLTFLKLAESVAAGAPQVLDVLEPELRNELEGFHFLDGERAVLVTSSRADNLLIATLRDKP